MSITKRELLSLYRTMVRIRKFEEAVRTLRSERKIPGAASLYTGQEAVASGVCAHLTKDDFISSTHRPLGHCVAKGADLKRLMAEICGKATGYNKGKAGAYHVADPAIGLVGANGIVGAGVPMAAGYALAAQIRGNKAIAVTFFGEGASNQGAVQETMNLASVWDLPLIFVCENSSSEKPEMLGHAMNYPQLNIKDISARGTSYGIPGLSVDGSDVIAVYKAAGEAVERARKGEGPTLLEFKTQQYEEPFRGTDAMALEEEWRKKDPILKFKAILLNRYKIAPKELEDIDSEQEREAEEAVRFAEDSPQPSPDELYTDVFVKEE